jgi:hypothetical protein
MDKFSIPAQAQPYVDALRGLLPTGVHASSTLDSSCLMELTVVAAAVNHDDSPARRAEAFMDCLERLADTKLQGVDQKISRILFGLGEWAGVPQRDRYEEAAKAVNSKWKWENFRKDPLDRFLLAVYLKLYREGEITSSTTPPNPENPNSMPQRTGIVGGPYIVNRYESTYNLPSQLGQSRHYLQTRTITATCDGVEVWRQSARWWRFNIEELPEVSLFGSGTLSIISDAPLERTNKPGRVYVTEVRFPKPLNAGETTTFTLLKQQSVDFDELTHVGWRDWHGLIGITNQMERVTVSVRFPGARIPGTIWYFEDLPEWLAPGVASSDNSVEADNSGFITRAWENLLIGHSYGLAWIW